MTVSLTGCAAAWQWRQCLAAHALKAMRAGIQQICNACAVVLSAGHAA
jgi:hypothetical protein